MQLHLPDQQDIAEIFSLCAPKNVLDEVAEFGLFDKDGYFDSLPEYQKHEMFALALFYANSSLVNFLKAKNIVQSLIIPPETLYSLTSVIKNEEFSTTESLLSEIDSQNKSKRGTEAVNARHSQPGGSRDKQNKIREIFASGKYGNNRNKCAKEEHESLFMSYDTARKALKNTPKPIPKT